MGENGRLVNYVGIQFSQPIRLPLLDLSSCVSLDICKISPLKY